MDQKEEIIRELKSTLAEEKRNKNFEIEESRKENIYLQEQAGRLENEVEEYADIEQNLRNEIITQGNS